MEGSTPLDGSSPLQSTMRTHTYTYGRFRMIYGREETQTDTKIISAPERRTNLKTLVL